ncbi:hypothetical protein C817_03230 [Dorea sp. 5-2]|nr:hypothetical protein C817_03230 [Dorea sp. 5-2]
MLDRIVIKNFKCFESLELPLRSLNVFAGLNGMGKSTVIQSLLVIKQSEQNSYLPNSICLNGNYVNVGMAQDILYEYAENECIEMQFQERERSFKIKVHYRKDADVLEAESIGNYQDTSLFKGHFEYLNAERRSPQVIYPKSSFHIDSQAQLGVNGEYTVHYLCRYQDKSIAWDKGKSLKEEVQFWLDMISPEVKFDVSEIENTDLAKLGFYYMDKTKSRLFRPTNVGFGISYVLPVIVALLKAERGSTLILENPEAHLHPKGQRKMGELIALCAAEGIQIFMETHSDHILNGIRIAVKQKRLKGEDAKLFYFSRRESEGKMIHVAESPQIYDNGKLSYWPDGFFDEWEKALDEIL